MLEKISSFFSQSMLSFKGLFMLLEPKSYLLIKVINPLLQLTFFCILARFCYNTNDVTSQVIGNSLLLCVYNTIFGVGSIYTYERIYGTLKVIIASPENKLIIFMEKSCFQILDSLVSVCIGLVFGGIIFKVNFSNVNLIFFIVTLIVAMFATTGFGMFIGSLGLVITDLNILMNIIAMSLLALSGANFPVQKLPNILKFISKILPLTRSIRAENLLMSGCGFNEIKYLIIQEIILGIIYIILGYQLMRFVEKISRKRATLDIF